jgi:nucleoside-diphosphate-sugar epimerase
MSILVTGCAGFIGGHLCHKLLERGEKVIGLDNLNEYYDLSLKMGHLSQLQAFPNFRFFKVDLADRQEIAKIFFDEQPDRVVNLAAQAGVRYSIKNPAAYIDSNLIGFANILEGCRHNRVEHLVYASSSSVYGANTQMPFATNHSVDHPFYNIGNNNPVELMELITTLEKCLGVEAKKEFLPIQMGDMPATYADVDDLIADVGFKPATPISEGIEKFVAWYRDFYKV